MADHLTPEQRHRAMANVKQKDGGLERTIRSKLHRRGYRFRKHVKDLPGTPDLVFPKAKVAVFIDGDFWHGFRFPYWECKLTEFWRNKIWTNRKRDQKNFRKLRRMGWRVLRIWQHTIQQNTERCINEIVAVIEHSPEMPICRK